MYMYVFHYIFLPQSVMERVDTEKHMQKESGTKREVNILIGLCTFIVIYMFVRFQTGSISMPSEEKSHGSISFKTYIKYFHLGAGYAVILLVLGVMVAGEVSEVLIK